VQLEVKKKYMIDEGNLICSCGNRKVGNIAAHIEYRFARFRSAFHLSLRHFTSFDEIENTSCGGRSTFRRSMIF